MNSAFLTIFALALAAPAIGQIARDRSCISPPITPGFAVSSIVGAWYEISSYPVENFPAKCTAHILSENDDGTVQFIVMYVHPATNISHEFYGHGIPDVENSIIDVTFTTGVSVDMQFVHSDYLTYAIMFGCIETGPTSSLEFAWVVSPTPTLSAEAQVQVNDYIEAYLDADSFVYTRQDVASCYGEPAPTILKQ